MAMCDNITGEAVGESFDKLYEAGAKNVQVMNTITKKNRPGYLYVIDCDEQCADDIENVLIREVGTTGWHRINSQHCYTDVDYLEKTVVFSYGTDAFEQKVSCKYSPNVPEPYRIERDCLEELAKKIWKSFSIHISVQRLSQLLISAFQGKKTEHIDLNETN